MIFSQIWAEPWYGKNSGLMQGLTTSPYPIQWTGRHLLSVPGPIAAQMHTRAALDLRDKPQRASRGPGQTERIGARDPLSFATLIVAQAIEGVGVAYCNFHRPALGVLAQDVVHAQEQISGEKGFEGWRWFSLPSRCACAFGLTPEQHDANEAPTATLHATARTRRVSRRPLRWDGVPNLRRSVPRASVRRSGRLFCAAHHGAFASAWGQLVELGADWQTPDHRGGLGKLGDVVLGGIAPIGEASELPPR